MKSVLSGVTRGDLERDPFPHVVIDQALDRDLYRALAASMPDDATLLDGRELANNSAYHFRAARILAAAAPLWQEFVRLHTSAAFFQEVVTLFGLDLHDVTTSIRGSEEPAGAALDCQITYGSPVTQPTRCHPVHVDRPVALYAGLLYFRRDDDDSTGGDLELYRFKGPRAYDAMRIVDDALVERVKTIPYAANRLVFFIHSRDALHGVSTRSVTPHPRLHVNFLAEFRQPVWELAA
ncbi:MAG TPA: hypothetical protein VGF48_25725 [Thermoanaerobaculia bacterium]|jgi:hypothetical protein